MTYVYKGRFWRCNDPAIKEAKYCGGYFSAYDLDNYQDNTTQIDHNAFTPTDNVLWEKNFEPFA